MEDEQSEVEVIIYLSHAKKMRIREIRSLMLWHRHHTAWRRVQTEPGNTAPRGCLPKLLHQSPSTSVVEMLRGSPRRPSGDVDKSVYELLFYLG